MNNILCAVVFIALCVNVFAGQQGSNLAPVTTAPRSPSSGSISVLSRTQRFQMSKAKRGAPKPSAAPAAPSPVNCQLSPQQLAPATLLSQYPSHWISSINVGPHNDNKLSDSATKVNVPCGVIISCQLDCLSLFRFQKTALNTAPVFSRCNYRYYSYGRYDNTCMTPTDLRTAEGALAIQICAAYNGCVQDPRSTFVSSVDRNWLMTASGDNANKFGKADRVSIERPRQV